MQLSGEILLPSHLLSGGLNLINAVAGGFQESRQVGGLRLPRLGGDSQEFSLGLESFIKEWSHGGHISSNLAAAL